MNIQDVADFIDLVKNPTKFEAALKIMKDEQARLTAVIETVGAVADIEKIRKETEKKAAKLESIYEEKNATFEAAKKTLEDKLALSTALSLEELKKNKLAGDDLRVKEAAYKKKQAELVTREQLLVNLEAVATEKEAKLNAMLVEYDEKIAKLKAVMV